MHENFATEILYGRDHDAIRIFISSKMDGSLDAERRSAAGAINRLDTHKSWWWEEDAPAGVLHSELECIQFARTSDGLILLVAGDLSDIIYSEYRAARAANAETYIFIREQDDLPDDVRTFITEERKGIVTRNFQNTAELETYIYSSLRRTVVRAARQVQLSRNNEQQRK